MSESGAQPRGGGTDLERGYGDVRPWRPPFHASPAARKGPISSKRVSSQDPLLRKFGNFSLNSLIFTQILAHKPPNLGIFSSQAPKFGNFQLTSPQIWKLSAHKPPFSEANVSSQAPHFGNPGRTPLPEKKLSAPPRGRSQALTPGGARNISSIFSSCSFIFLNVIHGFLHIGLQALNTPLPRIYSTNQRLGVNAGLLINIFLSVIAIVLSWKN